MQSASKAGAQFDQIKFAAHTVLFDHLRHSQLDRFVRGKPFVARQTTTPTAHAVTLIAFTRVDDLGIRIFTEWTFHF
jgi:hypothetical protein